ncbi:hypothetical protein ACIBIZ_22055 [Nonomuraea spiralis]|uniref:Uncharacterized protein n=1 Tax=Nonomuraea spiralis TaxID=46182 RepID=A0ABV5I5U8_9ACTN|nr:MULTISPECIES: hypothetical protein [Nonomuraea]RSN06603.1 hypothetical protein DMB42_25320 [Nonomuraea sp. WAC 01424]
MTGEVRALIGVGAGLIAVPPVFYLTEAGARALRAGQAAFAPAPAGPGLLAAAAVLVALLTAWPAAALACGLPLVVAGALFALDLRAAIGLAGALPEVWQPPWAEPPGTLAGMTGLYAYTGALLIFSALLPGRLRSILSR